MDIFDAQVHINAIGIEGGLAAMDAIGIAGAVLDEFTHHDDKGRTWPGQELANGGWRPTCEVVKAACASHPTRFAYLLRLTRQDPELEATIQSVKRDPQGVAVRLTLEDPKELEVFRLGGYADVFSAVQKHSLPLFLTLPGEVGLLPPYLEKFPGLNCIVDHCGLARTSRLPEDLEPVLAVARYPNVALKWAHAPFLMSKQTYPFADVIPYLERALKAFGPERIMWGSDHTISRPLHSWAESIFYIRDSDALSASDKDWIFGRTLAKVLGWKPVSRPAPVRY